MTGERSSDESRAQTFAPLFVVFSDDWGTHKSSSQHLFGHIAREHSVIWVNTVGMRAPKLNLQDLMKGLRKLSRMCLRDRSTTGYGASDPDMTVCQPFMLPYSRFDAVRAINARCVAHTLRRQMSAVHQDTQIIVVATVPNAGDYCDVFENATVVYYCVDDFTQWPGIDRDVVSDMERRLIGRADVLVAASVVLRDRLASFGRPTHLLTHGVDVDLFGRMVSDEHVCLSGVAKPRAGFFGLIDARTDQELIAAVAHCMPDVSFVLAGPVETRVHRLSACANVHFTGAVPYTELPALVSGLEALLIPYKLGALGNSLSPLKLKEYLVTGKPIVSTPIAEARALPQYVAIASTVEEWVCQLRVALAADPQARRRAIIPSMQSESWSYKARIFVDLCAQRAQGRSSAGTTPVPCVDAEQ